MQGKTIMTAPQTLSESEVDRLLYWLKTDRTNCRSDWQRHRDYLLGSLMADAGLRVSEVVSLRPEQLLFPMTRTADNKLSPLKPLSQLHLPTQNTKNGVSRNIPLTERITVAVREYFMYQHQRNQPLEAVFTFPGRQASMPISTRQVHRLMDRAGRAALHRPVHPHLLRHTFATRILRGSNTRVAQQLLGHKSLSSTQVYLNPNQDDCTKAVRTLEKPKGQ